MGLVAGAAILDRIPGAFSAGRAWVLAGLLLGLPALACHRALTDSGWRGRDDYRPLVTGMLVALLAWSAFWIWWLSPAAGRIFSFGLPVVSIGYLAWAIRRTGVRRGSGSEWLEVTGLGLACLVLLAWLIMGAGPEWAELPDVAANRSIPGLPIDNELPTMMAERIADGSGPGFLFGDWLTSDRPPLQAGWNLLLIPWLEAAGIPLGTIGLVSGLWMQMLWWPALGAMLALPGLGAGPRWWLRTALLPLGFFALHSVYVWPKLAAASLLLGGMLAAVSALRDPDRARSWSVIAGLGFGLGLMAHGAVAFAVLAAGLLSPWWIRSVGLRASALLVGTSLLLVLPWALYQKRVDPPGDRLLKWHLADVRQVDERGAVTVIAETYREMDWAEWWFFENPYGITTPKGQVRMMSSLFDSAVFPGQQGGPLEHVIASKAVAFGEALSPEFKEYQKQVKKNADVMAQAFIDLGYKVISGGTDNHSMLIDLRTKFPEITGKLVENTLVKAEITVNKNMVPFDSRSPFQTSGLRVGTPAITTRGVKEDLMPVIVQLIDDVISNIENEKTLKSVGEKVHQLMKDFPLFAY